MSPSSHTSSLATVIAISVVAYAGCDMVHEVLGHGLACALSPDIRAISLTTVALQTSATSGWVAAAGSIANIVAGLGAFVLSRRRTSWDAWTLFLALFAGTNLFNGSGYLIFSALFNIGDWAVVLADAEPAWLWRVSAGLIGMALYGVAIEGGARTFVLLIRRRIISRHEPGRVLIPAYFAGGLLLVLGAVVNPIAPSLIVTSGVSSGFGAMSGLAIIPSIVRARTTGEPGGRTALPLSLAWCLAGTVVAMVFVGVIGPGIRL